MYDKNNIFAKILRGEASCHKVFENDHALAFMDLMPQIDGHTLVIPKCEAEHLFDLDDDSASALICATKKVAIAVKTAFQAPGLLLVQLNGKEAGQTVFHIHFHIIPRHGEVHWQPHGREPARAEVLEANAEKIRHALAAQGA